MIRRYRLRAPQRGYPRRIRAFCWADDGHDDEWDAVRLSSHRTVRLICFDPGSWSFRLIDPRLRTTRVTGPDTVLYTGRGRMKKLSKERFAQMYEEEL